jgi:type I restriction enzyme S subunit
MSADELISPILCPTTWPLVRLNAITKKIGSGATPTGGQAAYQDSRTNYALVRSQNVFDRSFSESGLAFISDEQAGALKNVQLQEDDLLLNITGDGVTFGRTCMVPVSVLPACVNQHVSIIRLDQSKAYPGYVLSYLTHPTVKEYVEAFNAGGSRRAITKAHIESFVVPLPPLSTQKFIAQTLSALDDRITLLRETNATLEAIAQALFKSWFVDFDPVRAKMEGRIPEGMDEATAALFPDGFEESELGLVPRGWRVVPIGDAVEAVGGATPDTKTAAYWEPAKHFWTTPKDLSGIAAPVLLNTERQISDQGLAKIGSGTLPVGTLLLSSRAPIGYLALAQVPLAINQGYIAIPPGGLLPPLYMLFWCRQNMESIKGRANGSTFMEISKKAFRPIPALVPSPEVVQAFAAIADALFGRLIENEKQAQTLTTLRDTLLPRLISGQLRLPEAAAITEEVTA